MTMRRGLTACVCTAIAIHALLFVTVRAWLGSIVSVDVAAVAWSHRYYYDYASQLFAGRIPYRDFAFEYPLLSLPLFFAPCLLATDFESYRIGFLVEMFLFDVAAIVLLAGHGGAGDWPGSARRLGWYTLYCLLLAPVVIGRFELAPMVLAFAAACWWFSGRSTLGGTAAGLGMLIKVFPGLVAAPALVLEASRLRSSRPRGMAAFVATLGLGMACWLWLAGGRFVESLGYHAQRGLEIESLLGGIVLLAGTITGTNPAWTFDHNAYHLASWGSAVLARLALPLQAIAVPVVMWRYWRSGMADGLRFSAAAILAFIVLGKVLSPQYLIWLFPFLAALEGPTGILARKIFLLGCIITAFIYPGPGFALILDHHAGAILLLNLRNALLFWLLVVLLSPITPGATSALPSGDGAPAIPPVEPRGEPREGRS
jgi:hypothetical protein